MKQLLLFTIAALLVLSCRKKNSQKETELPPETQTGAYTFGCKVDGKVFVPRDGRGKPGLFAQYVNLGNGPGGGWYLNLPAIDQISDERITVNISTDSLFLLEGRIYPMKEKKGFAAGRYSDGAGRYEILSTDSGELTILKHDQTRRVLAGRFSFTATSLSDQKKVTITDGRFDIVY
ncbi:MAG TPA: hypothetical protein VF609_13015 [Flavisolibacter sp.]